MLELVEVALQEIVGPLDQADAAAGTIGQANRCPNSEEPWRSRWSRVMSKGCDSARMGVDALLTRISQAQPTLDAIGFGGQAKRLVAARRSDTGCILQVSYKIYVSTSFRCSSSVKIVVSGSAASGYTVRAHIQDALPIGHPAPVSGVWGS